MPQIKLPLTLDQYPEEIRAALEVCVVLGKLGWNGVNVFRYYAKDCVRVVLVTDYGSVPFPVGRPSKSLKTLDHLDDAFFERWKELSEEARAEFAEEHLSLHVTEATVKAELISKGFHVPPLNQMH